MGREVQVCGEGRELSRILLVLHSWGTKGKRQNKGKSLVVHADPRSQGFVSSLKGVDFIRGPNES